MVFEFYGEPQVSFTGRPYDNSGKEAPRWSGARVEGLICDTASPLKPEGDALYIEGNVAALRSVCEQLLAQLDSLESMFRADVDERIARSKQCPVCAMWFDTKYNEQGHGDGRGMGCLGDGTVMMGNHMILVQRDGTIVEAHVEVLKKGDRFTIKEPTGDYEKREFVALEDAVMRRGCGHVCVARDPVKVEE
jgi:hypothetical protein